MRTIAQTDLKDFAQALYLNEKARATVAKYLQAVGEFAAFLAGEEVTKQALLRYRDELLLRARPRTVNGKLTAIHAYLAFRHWDDVKIRHLKIQHQPFLEESRELSRAEYNRLLTAARRRDPRLYLLLMTLGGTGIRISELAYITVQAARAGRAEIRMKGKSRTILMPRRLCARLLAYCRQNGIREGAVFCTRSGRPLDRSNVWHAMKRLCAEARVSADKVFPHNFRHLFARMFYEVEKNLAHLADVLGHTRIETTRIYVAVSVTAHQKILERMELVQ